MVLRNIKNLDCESIVINHPYKHNDEYYVGEVYYNKEPFLIQTPVIAFKGIEDSTVELLLDKSTLKSINRIDNFIIKYLSEMSSEWFQNELTVEETRDIYKSSISFPIDEYDVASLRLKCSPKFKVYDKYNPEIEPNRVSQGTPLIALIKLSYIVFYKHTCIPQWECMSLKLKPKLKLDTCAILEETSDNEKSEDVKVVVLKEKPKLF